MEQDGGAPDKPIPARDVVQATTQRAGSNSAPGLAGAVTASTNLRTGEPGKTWAAARTRRNQDPCAGEESRKYSTLQTGALYCRDAGDGFEGVCPEMDGPTAAFGFGYAKVPANGAPVRVRAVCLREGHRAPGPW